MDTVSVCASDGGNCFELFILEESFRLIRIAEIDGIFPLVLWWCGVVWDVVC